MSHKRIILHIPDHENDKIQNMISTQGMLLLHHDQVVNLLSQATASQETCTLEK